MNGGNIDSFIILSEFSMNPTIIFSEGVKGIDIELDKKTNELRFSSVSVSVSVSVSISVSVRSV